MLRPAGPSSWRGGARRSQRRCARPSRAGARHGAAGHVEPARVRHLGLWRTDDECLGYIAQVIGSLELMALQEVREDLSALRRLMQMLGPNWSFLVTDVTEGAAGNGERLAYVYDSRKVRLGGLVGEIVLPGARRQFARTPFTVGFEVLGSSLQLCTTHVYYGAARAVAPRRLAEIRGVAEWLAARVREASAWSPNVCLLGDFNIFRRTDVTYGAIVDAGFVVPEALQAVPGSNVPKNKLHDQMALLEGATLACTGRAGVFDFFECVYRERDEAQYALGMGGIAEFIRSHPPSTWCCCSSARNPIGVPSHALAALCLERKAMCPPLPCAPNGALTRLDGVVHGAPRTSVILSGMMAYTLTRHPRRWRRMLDGHSAGKHATKRAAPVLSGLRQIHDRVEPR